MAKTIRSLVPYLVGGVVTLWPLPIYLGFMDLRLFEVGMFIVYAIGLICCLKKRVTVTATNAITSPFFLFVLLNLASFLFFSRDFSFRFSPNITGVGGSFIFFLLLTHLFRAGDVANVLRAIMVALSLVTLYLLAMHLLVYESLYLTPALTPSQFQVHGWAGRNPFGFLLVLLFPFVYALFCQKRNMLSAAGVIISLSAIVYLLSRMAVGGVFLTMFVLSMFPSGERKRFIIPSIALLLAMAAGGVVLRVGPQDYLEWRRAAIVASGGQASPDMQWLNLSGSRGRYLRKGLQGFLQRPVFGHGIGSFSEENPDVSPDGELIRYPLTHNDYVQILYELGLLGFVLFLWMFVYAFRRLLAVRESVPEEYRWLWNGQFASLVVLAASLLMTNAYETVPFWLICSGSIIIGSSRWSPGEALRQ